MSLIVFLALTITLGADPVPIASVYNWEIAYVDGVVEPYQSSNYKLTFNCREGRAFRSRVNVDGGQWSDWSSNEMICNPLLGDLNRDCIVGGSDFLALGRSFGRTCSE